jgi:hypothetical protein
MKKLSACLLITAFFIAFYCQKKERVGVVMQDKYTPANGWTTENTSLYGFESKGYIYYILPRTQYVAKHFGVGQYELLLETDGNTAQQQVSAYYNADMQLLISEKYVPEPVKRIQHLIFLPQVGETKTRFLNTLRTKSIKSLNNTSFSHAMVNIQMVKQDQKTTITLEETKNGQIYLSALGNTGTPVLVEYDLNGLHYAGGVLNEQVIVLDFEWDNKILPIAIHGIKSSISLNQNLENTLVVTFDLQGDKKVLVNTEKDYTISNFIPANASDKSIEWLINPKENVTIKQKNDASLKITFTKTGTYTITATAKDRNIVKKSLEIVASMPSDGFAIAGKILANVGEELNYNIKLAETKTSAPAVTWSVKGDADLINPQDNQVRLRFKSTGKVTLQATDKENNSVFQELEITVKQAVEDFTIDGKPVIYTYEPETYRIVNITPNADDKSIVWEITPNGGAQINAQTSTELNIAFTKPGNYQIKATAKDRNTVVKTWAVQINCGIHNQNEFRRLLSNTNYACELLSDFTLNNNGSSGAYMPISNFTGKLDGKGKKININVEIWNDIYAGVFNKLVAQEIKNLQIAGNISYQSIYTPYNMGILAAEIPEGQHVNISKVAISGKLTYKNVQNRPIIGGLIGEIKGSASIKDVYINATLERTNTKTGNSAGIVGLASMGTKLENCYAKIPIGSVNQASNFYKIADGGNIINSYVSLSLQTALGSGMVIDESKATATDYAGFDFVNTWQMQAGLPILKF